MRCLAVEAGWGDWGWTVIDWIFEAGGRVAVWLVAMVCLCLLVNFANWLLGVFDEWLG